MSDYEYTRPDRSHTFTVNQHTTGDVLIRFTLYGTDHVSDTRAIRAEDAPAVALAILEAAGIDGGQSSHAHHAVRALHDHEAARAAEAERETEDAKVRAFAAAIHQGPGVIVGDYGVSDQARRQYRAAREFFKGDA